MAEPNINEPENENKDNQGTGNNNQTQQNTTAPSASIDFNKLMDLVQGKQKVSEDSVLKGYRYEPRMMLTY